MKRIVYVIIISTAILALGTTVKANSSKEYKDVVEFAEDNGLLGTTFVIPTADDGNSNYAAVDTGTVLKGTEMEKYVLENNITIPENEKLVKITLFADGGSVLELIPN